MRVYDQYTTPLPTRAGEEKLDQPFISPRDFFGYNETAPLPGLPAAPAGMTYSAATYAPRTSKSPNRTGQQPRPDSPTVERTYSAQTRPDRVAPEPSAMPRLERTFSEPAASSSGEGDFDLRPPPPRQQLSTPDGLSELLFSSEHLESILHDPALFVRFTAFLNRYRPHVAPVLIRYLETQKAIKAVEYANAVAAAVAPLPNDESANEKIGAASLDTRFEERSKKAFETLVAEALPSYITYHLVKVVTECMVAEITGKQAPVMKNLVHGLSEVFCLTDPTQKDNPIVYASEGGRPHA